VTGNVSRHITGISKADAGLEAVSCYSSKSIQSCILTLLIRTVENYTELKWQRFALFLGHHVSLTSHHMIFLWGYRKDAVYISSFLSALQELAGRI
jgi:hypothetical protein